MCLPCCHSSLPLNPLFAHRSSYQCFIFQRIHVHFLQPGHSDWASLAIPAKPVPSCLFVFAVTERVQRMEGVGGSTCPFTSCGFLEHSFHKYSLSNVGGRMLCLYNHCFLLRFKPPQHISLQEALLRRSVLLICLWYGLGNSRACRVSGKGPNLRLS